MDQTPPTDVKSLYTASSTPVTHLPRKRKHDETLDFTTSPKFSSTLNESLITDLKDINLVEPIPSTPEKRCLMPTISSPIQESRKILYSSIKIVKPERKLLLTKSRQLIFNKKILFNHILNINVIMDVIFQYLSGGDLYRFSQVSQSFYQALKMNSDAFARYQIYKSLYQVNKENYVITPPGSPEKCDSPPRTNSESFNRFLRAAKYLNRSQSLTKCRKCEDVAVVENSISQCQKCGLIYCLQCDSFSETGAENFRDSCGHAVLRPKLSNMSNLMENSFFNFSSQDSGFYSENESPLRVKRNLFSSSTGSSKVLSVSNKNKSFVMSKKKEVIKCVPVAINNGHNRMPSGYDSPPRYGYAVGSKQSKKNLKRLTR